MAGEMPEQGDDCGEECVPCGEDMEMEQFAEELGEDFDLDDCEEVGSDGGPACEDDADDDVDLNEMMGDEEDENELHPAFVPEVDDALAVVSHSNSVLTVALSPVDKQNLVTGGQDDVAILWRIEEGETGIRCVERKRLEGHTDSVVQVAFSNDGKYVATGGYDGTVRIWLAENGDLVHTLEGPSKEVEWLLWHPKGHAILAGSNDTMAWMWWAPTGKLMQIFAGHAEPVTCGCWGLSGKTVVTGSADCGVIVWDPKTGQPKKQMKQIHEGSLICIDAHPNAPIVVTGAEDGTAKVLHWEDGRVLHTLGGHSDSVEEVRFGSPTTSSGMLLLATASMDGKIMVWDATTYALRWEFKDHHENGGITHFKWLPEPYDNWLCSCSLDGTSRLFDARGGGSSKHVFRGHSNQVLDLDVALDVSTKSVIVVSSSDDHTCRVFAAPLEGTGAALQAADGAAASAAAPAASADPADAPGAGPEVSQ